jgi:hypothetical protein
MRQDNPGTYIRLIEENIADVEEFSKEEGGSFTYGFMAGVSFNDFDTFVLLDTRYNLPLANAVLPSLDWHAPNPNSHPELFPSTPMTTVYHPTHSKYTAPPTYPGYKAPSTIYKPTDPEYKAPTTTSHPEPKTEYKAVETPEYKDVVDVETKKNKDAEYATSAGVSMLAMSTLGLASLSFCLFL